MKNLDERDGYFESIKLKDIKPIIPRLDFDPSAVLVDKIAIMAEIDLIDTFSVWHKNLHKNSLQEYRYLAEVYAGEYDNHYNDISTILTVEGVIVEIYSDLFKFKEKNGETERSKYQKERLLVLKNAIELLRKNLNRVDELKFLLKQSCIERTKLRYENKKLKEEVERLNNSHKEL
jgi:hypothetical protein